MIVPYRELPLDPSGSPRPTLDVDIGTGDGVRVRCLVDSGAMNTLLPSWAADLAGIDTADAPSMNLGVGGGSAVARLVPTLLTVGEFSWDAEVGFCDPWPRSWGLLGQRPFFRYFTVTFRTADFELEIAPVRG